MNALRCLLLVVSFLFAASILSEVGMSQDGATPSPAEIRVMSFNIRYGTANDGENHWDKRKEFLLDTIKAYNPDLLGTQETLGFQKDFIAAAFPEYAWLGVGREDGKEQGEMTALFYRTARFEKISTGHFWLSETPDVAGSKSWDSSLPRMVSYVFLKDKQNAQGSTFLFLNTHFDHRGEEARQESAKLIVAKAKELAPDQPAILTGDFNAPVGSGPYTALFGTSDSSTDTAARWIDTFRVAHPQPEEKEGTFSGFKVTAQQGPRIDWIGCTSHWKVINASIDRTERDGRTPSDHFPVTAELKLGN